MGCFDWLIRNATDDATRDALGGNSPLVHFTLEVCFLFCTLWTGTHDAI